MGLFVSRAVRTGFYSTVLTVSQDGFGVRVGRTLRGVTRGIHKGITRGILTDELWSKRGFIPAEILVLNGTAGDNGAAGGT